MKRIIGLSAAFVLLISVMAGFSALAVDKEFYDIDFDSWNLNISATTENAADILNDVSDAATEKSGDGWTLDTISGNTTVSTVVAEEVNPAWTDRGKILKVAGNPMSNTSTESRLKITVPVDTYKIADYDNDRLYIEYDLFVPAFAEEEIPTANGVFSNVAFGNNAYAYWNNLKNTNTMAFYGYPLNDPVANTGGVSAVVSGVSLGTWLRVQVIIDAKSSDKFTYSDVEYTDLRTMRVNITNLATEDVMTYYGATRSDRYADNFLYFGNGHNKNVNGEFYVDNLNVYKKNKFSFVSSADDETENVLFDKEYVEFTMNAPVDEDSLSTITLTGADATVDTFAEVLEDGKTVRVNILENMEYGTLYTVDFAGVKDTEGRSVETEKTAITFTTEAAPALYVAETKMFSGYGATMENVDAIVAADKLYTVSANVKSSVNEAKTATAIVAVYDSFGRLSETVYVSKNIPALAEETIAAGMTIPAELAGGKVKMFLWNNVNTMQPYTKAITATIAAAE